MPSQPQLDELHSKLESRYKIYKLRDALDALAGTTTASTSTRRPALNFYTRSA
jgi:chromosome partitioning protein